MPTPRPSPAPRPNLPPSRPVGDAGPPPTLPDIGAPPTLPATDPTPAPTPAPGAPPPRRPTAPTTVAPAPPPAAAPGSLDATIPEAPPAADPGLAELDQPVPSASPGDPGLRAPSIDGGDPLPGAAPAKPTVEDLDALEKERLKLERRTPRRWRHSGIIVELQIGTGGCTRAICRTDAGHDAAAGAHLGGFLGGNVFGILELGLEASWNTLRPRGTESKNAVSLYGLDPERLEQEIAKQQGVPGLEVDFSTLVVDSTKSRFVNVGPTLRVHFIRKGRGIAYAGTGVHYQLWRNSYVTKGGDLRLDFHGLTVPIRVGGGAYVHPNIAVVGEFSYSVSKFFLGGVKHPQVSAVAPISIVESTAVDAGASLTTRLPHFWNFSVNLRFRF